MARTFPRAAARRLLVALLASAMVFGVFAAPQASADLKHKKHRVEKHIKTVRSDLDESSARLRRATAALSSAEHKLTGARERLAAARGEVAAARVVDQQMQEKLAAAEATLAQARQDLADGQAQIEEQERTLGQIVVSNMQADPSLMGLSMVLTSQDVTQLSGQLNSVQNVMDKEKVTLDRLKASKVLLTVQETEVEAAQVTVAAQRQVAARNLARKRELEQAAAGVRQEVRGLFDARRTARHRAARARHADARQLRKLQRENQRISAVLKKRAEAARRRALAAKRAHATSSRPEGILTRPVPGYVTSSFGWRIHPIYGYRSLHDGVDLGAGCGTPIRAAASGRVLQEYFQTAWGNRLILDHGYLAGAGLATIYNHLSRYAVSSGEHVERGQVIGYVGTTGWSTGCHLHFTLMRNGVPVDPMPYF